MRVIVDVADWQDGVDIDSFVGTPDEVCQQLTDYGFSNFIVDRVDTAISDLIGELPRTQKSFAVARYDFSITKV